MALMPIGAAFAEGNPPIATIEMADGGVISMARAQDPDSAGSQFFIMHADGVEYVAEKIQ